MFKSYLISTTHQKILDYFITHPEQSFYGAELSKKVNLSLGAVNKVLKEFRKDKILVRTRRGKTDFYSLKDNRPIINQLKVLSGLLSLEPLVEELKHLSHKIILYGSSGRGDNDRLSDIDLLIVTTNSDKPSVEEKINDFQEGGGLPKIQAAIKTTSEWASIEDKDPTYFHEVLKGLTLWDRMKSYEGI